jgi:hypothetical protein
MYNDKGIITFQGLKQMHSLPGISCFLYLQLRPMIKAYGVPWDAPLTSHKMFTWIYPSLTSKMVSATYECLLSVKCSTLGVTLVWNCEMQGFGA